MKERPILFSAPMVRAILAGTKTQTRRALRDQPCELLDFNRGALSIRVRRAVYQAFSPKFPSVCCPYGQPGDRLWVRESFCDARQAAAGRVLYQASGDTACGWKPSIHMPRWASRITLQVTNVRVERLQDISELDASAEGAPELLSVDGGYVQHAMGCYRDGFQHLWTSINGPGSWDTNPWVWVVEFRRLDAARLLDA